MRKHKKLIAALSAVIIAVAAVLPAAALAADTPRAAEPRNYEPLYMTAGGWVDLNADGTIPEGGINKNPTVWYQGSTAVLQAHPGAKDDVYQSRIVWTKWDGSGWQDVTSGWLDPDRYALEITVPGDQVTYRCTAIWDDEAHRGEEWVMDYVVTGTPTRLVMDGPYDAAAGQRLTGAEVSAHWEPAAPVDRNGSPLPITWTSSERSVQGISLGYTDAQATKSVYQIQRGVMPLEGFKIYCDVRTGDPAVLWSEDVYIDSVFMAKDPDNDGGGFMTPGGVPGPMTAGWPLSPGGQPNAVSGKYTYSWSVASPNGKVPAALEKECQSCTGLTFASKTPIDQPGTYVFTCTPICNGAAIPTSAAVFSLLVGNAAEYAQYDISFSRNPENINALPDSIVAGSGYTLYAHAEPGAPWPDDAQIAWTVTDASGRKVVPSTVVEHGSPAEINLDVDAIKATAPTHYTFTAAVVSGGTTLVQEQIEIPVLPFYVPTLEPLMDPVYVRTPITISISGTSGAQGATVQWLNDGVVVADSGTFSVSADTRSLTITPQDVHTKYIITARWVVGTQAASRESAPVAFMSQLFTAPSVSGENDTCVPGAAVTIVAEPWSYDGQKWPDGAKINWACSDGRQYPASTVSGNRATLQYTVQNTDTTMFHAVLVDSEGRQMSYTGVGMLTPALLGAPALTVTPGDGLIPTTSANAATVTAAQPPAGMTLAWTIDGQAMNPSSLPTGIAYDASTRTVSVTGRSAVVGAAFMSGAQQVSQAAAAIVQYADPDLAGVSAGLVTGDPASGATEVDTTVAAGSKPQILAKIDKHDSTEPTGTFTWTIVHDGKETKIEASGDNEKEQDGYTAGVVTATSTEANLTVDMALPGLYAISAAFLDAQGNATSNVGVWGFYVAPLMLGAKPDPAVISLGDSVQITSWLYGGTTDINQMTEAGAEFYWTGSGILQNGGPDITAVPQAAGLQTYSVQCRIRDQVISHTANALVRAEQPSVTLQGPDTLRAGARAGYVATTPSMETALPGDGIYKWSATGGTIDEDNDIGWYTPSVSGTQTVSVRVTDHSGKLLGTASKTVEVIGEDEEPAVPDMEVALAASPSDTVESGTEVTVTGTVSNAPDGAELEYLWTVPTELGGKTDGAQWTFEAPNVDAETQYTASLAVTGGTAAARASISITVKPGASASVPPSDEPGPEESVQPSASQGPGPNAPGVQPSDNPFENPSVTPGEIPGQTPGGTSSQAPGASSGSESSPPAQVIPTVRPQQSSPVSYPDARPSRPAGTTSSNAPAASASSEPGASASSGAGQNILPPVSDAPLDYQVDQNPMGGGFILVGIPISTPDSINTVMDLLLSIAAPPGSKVEILNADDEPASLGGAVATGMTVRVTGPDGTVISEIPIVVAGDVMGTGQMDLTQLVWMAQCVLGEREITGLFLLAGDFTGTGSINLTDLVRESWLLIGIRQR